MQAGRLKSEIRRELNIKPKMSFAGVYPQYVRKAEAKGRSRAEVDEIVRWLTGYSQGELEAEIG